MGPAAGVGQPGCHCWLEKRETQGQSHPPPGSAEGGWWLPLRYSLESRRARRQLCPKAPSTSLGGGGGGLGSNSSPWGPAPLFFGLLTDPWGTREPQAGRAGSSLSQRRSSSPGVGGDHLAQREGWGRRLPPASTPVGTSSPVPPGPGWAGISPCRGVLTRLAAAQASIQLLQGPGCHGDV